MVMDQLVAKGRVVRGSLGVVPADVPVDLRSSLGTRDGAYIRQVTVGSPADKAGLQAGDVVVRFNGRQILDENALREAIGIAGPGASVKIDVLRDSKPQSITAVLGELREQPGSGTPEPAPAAAPKTRKLGFVAEPVSPDMREKLGLPRDIDGVVVRSVDPGSPADEAGLAPGMILTAVNGRKVVSREGLDSALAEAKSGKILALKVMTFINDGSDTPTMSRGVVTFRVP